MNKDNIEVVEENKLNNMIKKCAQENPGLPIEFVKELLISKNQDRSLAKLFTTFF